MACLCDSDTACWMIAMHCTWDIVHRCKNWYASSVWTDGPVRCADKLVDWAWRAVIVSSRTLVDRRYRLTALSRQIEWWEHRKMTTCSVTVRAWMTARACAARVRTRLRYDWILSVRLFRSVYYWITIYINASYAYFVLIQIGISITCIPNGYYMICWQTHMKMKL